MISVNYRKVDDVIKKDSYLFQVLHFRLGGNWLYLYVRDILEEFHSCKSGENLGVNKTLDKIWRRFYGFQCREVVERWCRTYYLPRITSANGLKLMPCLIKNHPQCQWSYIPIKEQILIRIYLGKFVNWRELARPEQLRSATVCWHGWKVQQDYGRTSIRSNRRAPKRLGSTSSTILDDLQLWTIPQSSFQPTLSSREIFVCPLPWCSDHQVLKKKKWRITQTN